MRSQQKKDRKNRNRTVALLLILSFLVAMLPTFMLSAEADTDEITIVREEADRRNANERHYLCSDGSIMAVAFSGDVHYLDADGKYQVIDNSLVYDNIKGLYRTKDNPNFKVAFGDNTKSPSVQLTDNEGNTLTAATTVALRLESTVARRALESASASLKVANREKITVAGKSKQSADLLKVPENSSEMKYQNSFGNGISAEYAVDGYSLKENVVFEYPVNYTAIETRYTMDGLWVDINDDGSLILYNEDNVAIYTVAAPYMYDAAGSECPSVDVQATLEGDTIVVRYIPDEAWRSSSERVYPVVFDPFTHSQYYSNIGDMYSTATNGTYSGVTNDLDSLKAGVECYSTNVSNELQYVHRTYIKPTSFPTIPNGNIVKAVELVLKKKSVVGTGHLQYHKVTGGDFVTNTYTLGDWIEAFSYSSTNAQSTYTLHLPIEDYNNCGNGYVIRENLEEPNSSGSHYVTFYSSRASAGNKPKIVATYVPIGIENKITALHNTVSDRYVETPSEGTLQTIASVSIDGLQNSLWKLMPAGTGSFRIVSEQYSNKCLSLDASGNVVLVDRQYTASDTKQLWYIMVSNNQYAIVNEYSRLPLYIDSSQVLCCGMPPSSEYQWKFTIPDLVVMLKNKDMGLYLKNKTGMNYNTTSNSSVIFEVGEDNRISAMNYVKANASVEGINNSAQKAEAIGDLCGYRLVYYFSQQAYMIMPISSGNGHQRALTARSATTASTSSMMLHKCTSDYQTRQLFLLELQSDGSYVIKLKNKPSLVLTANGTAGSTTGTVTMSERTDTLTNQTWDLSEYEVYLPKGTGDTEYPKVSYDELEKYYKSLGFLSPLGEFELTITSDIGKRNPNDGSLVHRGLDLRTRTETSSEDHYRDLYASVGGIIVEANNEDRGADGGLYVKIDTGIPAYYGSEYTVCIVYMHMDSVAKISGSVEAGEIVGVSGSTGNVSPHLHYGVFLRKSGESYSANRNPLNPLLFIDPEYYANGEPSRLPQVYGEVYS